MKAWLIGLAAVVLVLGGIGYVYADPIMGVHRIVITDRGIEPKTISVKLNSAVKVKVVNKGTKKHNLVIPDYFIFTHNLNVGEETDAEFTANKEGSFPYFSDTPGEPEPGIRGTLTVK